MPVQEWILQLRRRGISVLIVHHAGKGGDQRGTSAKEDVLDTVIKLSRPDDYNPMARSTYNTKAWKFTRLRQLSEAPHCAHCGRPATQVDHIVPVESGGHPFDPENLQSLCQSCHSSKTAIADGGYGNKKKRGLIKGCDIHGMPLDPSHPWRLEQQQQKSGALREEKFTRACSSKPCAGTITDLVQ